MSITPAAISLPSRPGTSCPLNTAQLIESVRSIDVFDHMFSELSAQGYRDIINNIMKKLRYKSLHEGSPVYLKGEKSAEIYFVVTGLVVAVVGSESQLQEIKQYRPLHGFGEAQAVSQTKRMFTTIAKEDSYLAYLRPSDFAEVVADYRTKVYIKKFIRFQDHPFLSQFTKSQLQILVHNTAQLSLQKNQVLYQEGSESEDLYLICKGQVKLVKSSPRGIIDICTLYQGELVGEVQVILGELRHSSAISSCESLQLYSLDKKVFMSQFNPFMQGELLPLIQTKHEQRCQRFNRFSEARKTGDNPKVTIQKVNQLLERGRKIVDTKKRSKKTLRDPFTAQIINLVAKKKKVASFQPQPQPIGLCGKYQLFQFGDALRPKVLRRKSHSIKVVTQKSASPSPSPKKSIQLVTLAALQQHSAYTGVHSPRRRQQAYRKIQMRKRSNTETDNSKQRLKTQETMRLPPIKLLSHFSIG